MERTADYTDPEKIKPKVSHTWTQEQLERVYTMRQWNISVPLIIASLHLPVKNSQVYNAIRMMKNKFIGRCSCGKKLTKEELKAQKGHKYFMCDTCREKNRLTKEKLLKRAHRNRMCIYCKKEKADRKRNSCAKCRSQTYRRRISQGLCGGCGVKPIDKRRSRSHCTECLDKNRKTVQKRRQKKAATCK